MTSTDRQDFRAAIEALLAAFSKEPSKPLFVAFWAGLEDLSLADVQRACFAAIRESDFMPTVAKLREFAGHRVMSLEDRAQIAWGKVYDAIEKTSGYINVDFRDPAIHATVREMGGWITLCSLPKDEILRFRARDFMTTYRALAAHAHTMSEEATRPLVGIYHQDCAPEHRAALEARPEGQTLVIETGLPPLIGAPDYKLLEANAHS